MKPKKALQQGNLDCLCGVYALLNTYRLLVPQVSEQRLFNTSIKWLDSQKLLFDAVKSGLEVEHLLGMIKDIFKPAFPFIKVRRLWTKEENPKPGWFNRLLKKYVAPPSSTVLVCYKYEHWTVFQKYDETQIYLYDSEGRRPVDLQLSEEGLFDPRNILLFHKKKDLS